MTKPDANERNSIGFWKNFFNKLTLVWLLLKDKNVPFKTKLIPLVTLLYLIIPIDFLPDVFPFLGSIDDLTVIIIGLNLFINLSPPRIVKKYSKNHEKK